MRELWPLLLTNALCMACMTSFIAVAGPLVREQGLAEWHGGLIITLAGVCWMLLSRAWGRASDARGRKPVLLTGIGGFAIAYLLLGAAIDLALTRRPGVLIALTMLALLRGLIGSFYAAIPPASAALIADRTGPERRAQGMAVLGAANGVGIILGPLMGGLLAVYGLDVPMYAAAMLPLLALFVLWRTLPAEAAPGGTDAPAVRLTDPRLRLPLAIMLLVVSCVNVAQLCVGFFVLDRLGLNAAQGARMAGLTMAGVGVPDRSAGRHVPDAWSQPAFLAFRRGVARSRRIRRSDSDLGLLGSGRLLRCVRRGLGCGFSGLPGPGRQLRDGYGARRGRGYPLGGSGSGHGRRAFGRDGAVWNLPGTALHHGRRSPGPHERNSPAPDS